MAASLIWALSFGLIKRYLGDYDPLAVASLRLAVSALAFAPWLRRQHLPAALIRHALVLGAVQFGLMYVLYISAYAYLPAYAVAVFTIFTPLYVVTGDDLMRRRFSWRHGVAALLAVAGAAIIVYRASVAADAWKGILLLQAANLCFAAGQLGYRRLYRRLVGEVEGGRRVVVSEPTVLGWMYLGALLVSAAAALLFSDGSRLAFSNVSIVVLLYLGLLPTAAGFYLWNKGAARTRSGRLAAGNNLKIPLAVLCAWLLFGETAHYLRVLIGLAVIVFAMLVADDRQPDNAKTALTDTASQA